jgi:hypothetical protein
MGQGRAGQGGPKSATKRPIIKESMSIMLTKSSRKIDHGKN